MMTRLNERKPDARSKLTVRNGLSRCAAIAALSLGALFAQPHSVEAVSTRVVATVNDRAISAYQIQQRMKLMRVLQPHLAQRPKKQREKDALQALIDDELKRQEAKKQRVSLTIAQVDKIIEQQPGLKGLADRLKSQGLSNRLVKNYIITTMSWNRIVSQRFPQQSINEAQVDARFQQIQAEFKKQAAEAAVTIYQLLPITLPVDRQATRELTQEVARSRLIEANRYVQRFRSCRSARKAASGIFNVRIGKRLPADPRKMPPQMRNTLNKRGPGSAFVMGVAPDMSSVQIMAFCGRKRIAPEAPKVTREIVRRRVEDELYNRLGQSYLRDLRKNAFIEYKDASLRK